MSEQRAFYRKNLHLPGHMNKFGEDWTFRIMDLSLNGLRGSFTTDPSVIVGNEVSLQLPELNLEGTARVVRVSRQEDGGVEVGFQFSALDGVDHNRYHYRAEEE